MEKPIGDFSKPVTYVSERVVNIKELEGYIERAHLSTISLIRGIEEGKISTAQETKEHLKRIVSSLEKAYQFDFCVERRTTICN